MLKESKHLDKDGQRRSFVMLKSTLYERGGKALLI